MTTTNIEHAVTAAVLTASAGHPFMFGHRLTIIVRSTGGTLPVAGTGPASVRIRITVRTPPRTGIWGLAEQALAGLPTRVAGWVRKVSTKPASGLERALRVRPRAGPVLGAALVTECGAGMSAGSMQAMTRADARLAAKNIEADANPASADQEKLQ